jgi:phosphoglycerate kinase
LADYLTLDDIDVANKRVLLRSDLNVPLAEGEVADDFRIRSSIPTIAALRDQSAIVIVTSHLGRPGGPDASLSLGPIAERMAELGGFPVTHVGSLIGPEADQAIRAAQPGAVILLENTRFESGEKTNDPGLAGALAKLAEVFVLDAFGSAHRAHASTVGVAALIPSAAGPLLAAEVEALDRLLHDPERPYVVALGGAKVSDKLGVMQALLPKVDVMLVGGGMCFTLLEAEGYEVGGSLVEEEMIKDVRRLLESEWGSRVSLPTDIVVAGRFAADAEPMVAPASDIPSDAIGMDIGPDTAQLFASVIRGAGSLFWNGPMGVFEWDSFRGGTEVMAKAVAESEAFSVVGGGDSVAALRTLGLEGEVSHLSTGGGAALEYLEKGTLPGLEALRRWADGT